MIEPTFDPGKPLAGPPDPWRSTDTPSARSGPPYHMTEMIAAEPYLAERLLTRLARDPAVATLADAVTNAARSGGVVIVGCGTSEHGALGVAEILGDAVRAAGISTSPGAVITGQAFETSLDPPRTGLVIGISHEGGTAATNAALVAASAAGASTALITVSDRSPGAALAQIVVQTDELDQSWCHTVGYLSPILAGAALGARIAGGQLDPVAARDLVAAGAALEDEADAASSAIAHASKLLVIASGADRPAGRELVLKVEEASWLPSAYRDLETLLHGHLPATGEATAMVAILTDRHQRDERIRRMRQALAAAQVLGIRTAAIFATGVSQAIADDLTPAGRLVVPEGEAFRSPVAALLGSATALQLLTERVARARGTNPDPIRRDDPRYVAAADAAER
jgi:glucosamine 6-phosphate synthetase-like amidotransferase/phosphosugar isomerase protein